MKVSRSGRRMVVVVISTDMIDNHAAASAANLIYAVHLIAYFTGDTK